MNGDIEVIALRREHKHEIGRLGFATINDGISGLKSRNGPVMAVTSFIGGKGGTFDVAIASHNDHHVFACDQIAAVDVTEFWVFILNGGKPRRTEGLRDLPKVIDDDSIEGSFVRNDVI